MKEKAKTQEIKESQQFQWSFNEKYEEWRPSMPNQTLKNRNCMRWSAKENKIYCEFLKVHKQKFSDKVMRKKTRVYQMLSKKLRKRTALQVKSHHQKMMKRFQNIQNLITQLQTILNIVESQSTAENQKASTQSLDPQHLQIKEQQQIAQIRFIMLNAQIQLELGIEPINRNSVEFDNARWFADE